MKKGKKTESISTILGLGSRVEGTIEFQNTMRLDGQVIGKIRGNSGTVVIGEKAIVDAEIIVEVAIVMGQVNGIIDASERIEIYPPGRVVGDIQAPTVLIEAGVIFNGNCVMGTQANPTQKAKKYAKKQTFIDESEG